MQYGDSDDKVQVELVGDIDMLFFLFDNGVEEYGQIGQLDNCQLDINILFGFGVFFGLGCVQQVFCCCQYDKQLIVLEYKL